MNNTRNYKEFLQAAVFVLLFLAILLPVSYMVRTNGDVKDRFAGFYAEKKDFPIMPRLSFGGRRGLRCILFLPTCSVLPPCGI